MPKEVFKADLSSFSDTVRRWKGKRGGMSERYKAPALYRLANYLDGGVGVAGCGPP
ncbi:hypothetical protein PRUB_a4191 [Pseudoalteromonas rubra]|uniref:Uncharacterized protein n=1 Tax=Pseudoalteromonas rubra TaxID=43658 RepID=A0A8T0C437_9GAMM|nr:hypothetical protein PRUB_a4188 [Pseudoalteromonas rubra]KAF7785516.1 hypothetical protein PRUB_a4191 [Pseudoalteromonas rubra]